ncbi:HNH endonuclease [Iodobacter sp. LRB]|uniref:HNH endonuclease n=1 Tax=unclassified Iodobacter TaxID=235634 RepID=UPI0015D51CCC|nr:HNH endonuclease [Iodobacter sp. BJB302]
MALDALLLRLRNRGLEKIRIHIVSSNAIKIWKPEDRIIEIDGNLDISLKVEDLKDLRGKISKAQQEKKEDPTTKGGSPTKRILIEANLSEGAWKEVVFGVNPTAVPVSEGDLEIDLAEFLSEDGVVAKEKVIRAVALRRGQPKFRKKLLTAYKCSCAVTGTLFSPILEAAHIIPYMGAKTNHVTNGILLRADIHTLFDLGLLGINQDYKVVVSSSMKETEYEAYNGRRIILPENEAEWPSLAALKSRPLPSRH